MLYEVITDVELVGEEIERARGRHVQWRDQTVKLRAVLDRRRDRAARDQGIAFEIHLGDQTLAKAVAIDRNVDVHRPPVIRAVRPRIGPRTDRQELVIAVLSYNFV